MQTVTKKYRSLECDVNIQVPASNEDFDSNAKKAGACLEEAINNVVYRGVLNDFRDKFCDAVEAKTGVERRTQPTGKKDDKGADILEYAESEKKYVDRVRAEKGWTEDNSVLQSIADEIATTLTFDASATERKPSLPKKLANDFRVAAERIFTNGTEAKYATQWNLAFTGDRAKDIETLGWAIKADFTKKQGELLGSLS